MWILSLKFGKRVNNIPPPTNINDKTIKTSLATSLAVFVSVFPSGCENENPWLNNKIKNEKIIKDLTEQNNSIQSNINENLKEQIKIREKYIQNVEDIDLHLDLCSDHDKFLNWLNKKYLDLGKEEFDKKVIKEYLCLWIQK